MSSQSYSFKKSINELPAGVFAATLGSITLGNVMNQFGITSVRHIAVNLGVFVLLLGVLKVFMFPKKVWEELNQTIGCSIYPTFTMALMLTASYYSNYFYTFGRYLWLFAVILHVIILIIFVYNNMIKKFNFKEFIPSTYVPFVGLIVATISSPKLNFDSIAKWILYFSTIAYFIMLPFLTYRLIKYEVNDKVFPIVCITAAPPSLCIVAYTTFVKDTNFYYTTLLYFIIALMTLYMYLQLPKIFNLPFLPSHAGITFPLAITTLASLKYSAELEKISYESLSTFFRQLAGFQIVLASAGILFVIFNFVKLFYNSGKQTN